MWIICLLDESEVDVAATRAEDSSNSENETALVKKKDFLDTGFPGDHKNCKSSLKAYIIDRNLSESIASDHTKAMYLEITV